jgi:transcriptional regulator with XRE-family HTH domain
MATNTRIASTSDRLKEAMHEANKTPADLARATGLNKSTISRYLSGAVEPKQMAVAKLASSLNVSEMWLWGYDIPMRRAQEIKKAAPEAGSGMGEAKKKLFDLAENCTEEEAGRLVQMLELFLGKR